MIDPGRGRPFCVTHANGPLSSFGSSEPTHERAFVSNGRRVRVYGVHWTSLKGEAGIESSGLIRASNDLIWFERAESLPQLKQLLQRGGTGTGARGNRFAIVVDLTGLRPRIMGGGGAAYRLPDGLPLTGLDGRGITWYSNTGAGGDINKIVTFIRQGRRSY